MSVGRVFAVSMTMAMARPCSVLRSAAEDVEAVDGGHHHVEHDAVRPLGLGERQCLGTVLRLVHLPALELEHGAQQVADRLFVVDDQRPKPCPQRLAHVSNLEHGRSA